MDRFLAAISLNNDLAPGVPELLGQALLATGLNSRASNDCWADHRLALVCARADRHSDTAFYFPPGPRPVNSEPFIYLNGPLSQPGIKTNNSNIRAETPYSERIAALSALFKDAGSSPVAPDFGRLSGSFQALIYQPGPGRVWLVADRLASRTLFYCRAGGLLLAASDIRSLLALPQVSPALDIQSLSQFVRYQMILGSNTLYHSIKTVPGGQFLAVGPEREDSTVSPYWVMKPLPPYATKEEAVEATSGAFVTATRRNLEGSLQPGLLLSGGLDSRMMLASLAGENSARLRTYTFGEAQTYETLIARRVARTRHLPWYFIEQSLDQYWQNLDEDVALTNGLHSLAHTHLRYPASQLAADGCDTILHGWGMDAFHSGSYLPKRSYRVLGRTLTDYGLVRLKDRRAVVAYLHGSLDVQKGIFENSLFGAAWREEWQTFPEKTLETQIAHLAERSPEPYDWIDYALFGQELARFRSTPMMTSLRAFAKERNPLFENEFIESYQRLPYRWRFLGPVFRQSLYRLSPALVDIPYSNLGVSPLAPPLIQALSLQGRAMWRANKARLTTLLQHSKTKGSDLSQVRDGNYLSAAEMVGYLSKTGELAAHILQLLERGPLVEAGLFDPARLQPALQRAARGDESTGFTIMAWVSLALWFDTQPFQLS